MSKEPRTSITNQVDFIVRSKGPSLCAPRRRFDSLAYYPISRSLTFLLPFSFKGKRAQWEAIQKQTFTRWANQYLLDRMLEMKNLYDGTCE